MNVGPWKVYPYEDLGRSAAPLRKVLAHDVLAGLPPIGCGGRETEHVVESGAAAGPVVRALRGLADARSRAAPAGRVTDHQSKQETPLNEARMSLVPLRPGADWRNLPNVEYPLRDGARTAVLRYTHMDAEAGRRCGVCPCMALPAKERSKAKHTGQEGTLIPWCLPHTAARCNQWHALFGRVDPRSHLAACVATPHALGKQGMNLHPRQHRILSCREMARAQGFPDGLLLLGDVGDKYRHVGNAVPPPLARALGRAVVRALWPRDADEVGL